MNRQLLDPFELEYPEEIEACIDDEYASTCRFNRRGNYLATARSDGYCWIWDIETLTTSLKLHHSDHAVTCVSWSKSGRYLLSTDEEGLCIVWDLKSAQRLLVIELSNPIVDAKMCNSKKISFIACLSRAPPVLVEFSETDVPPAIHHITLGTNALGEPIKEMAQIQYTTCCALEPKGRYAYFGTSKGHVLAVDIITRTNIGFIKLCPSAIKSINVNFRQNELVTNANDRVIRVITINETEKDSQHISVEFNVITRVQDHVNRVQWSQVCFSSSGEFIVAGSHHKAEHHIYIWDKVSGSLMKMLTGPHELLEDISVHPMRPIIASISTFGMIYMWTRKPSQNWSAFAPGFRELEENIDYSEPETEFDKNPTGTVQDDKAKASRQDNIEDDIDIIECDPLFSDTDSDDSDKLFYIPVAPDPDTDIEGYSEIQIDNGSELTLPQQSVPSDINVSQPNDSTGDMHIDSFPKSVIITTTATMAVTNGNGPLSGNTNLPNSDHNGLNSRP